MSFIVENLILEASAPALATTDAVLLQGSPPGYFPFSAKYANLDTCHYLIRAVDVVGRPTGQVEIGRGTILVNAGAYSLRRDTVFRSSNADALVAFDATMKYVSVSAVAPSSDPVRFDLQSALGLDIAGQVAHFAMTSPPPGWLKANGAAVSRSAYARLFARISTTYGVGDGSTTFNLPDGRGEFLRGWDDGRALDSGRALGTVQAGDNLTHTHGLNDPGHAHGVYDPTHAHGIADGGHAHGAWTDAQGNHDHANGVSVAGGAYGLQYASPAFAGNIAQISMDDGYHTDARGVHGHNVGIYASGTGIGIYGAGTGIGIYGAGTGQTVQATGVGENRPRNLSLLLCVKF